LELWKFRGFCGTEVFLLGKIVKKTLKANVQAKE